MIHNNSDRKVNIGLVQMAMGQTIEENLKKAANGVKKAAKAGANIVALPEVFTAPYFPQLEKFDASEFAEKIPGETTNFLSNLASENGVVLVGGSVYEKSGKKFFNTAPVFDEKGKMLGIYRKMHIPHDPNFYEQNYFAPGDLGYKVFETKFGKIAPLICYDQWFPEAAREVALKGAEILIYPTAIATVKGVEQVEGSWQKGWEAAQVGHAVANSVVVAAINRVGTEHDMSFWGGSFICNQFADVLKRGGHNEEIVIATVDLGLQKHLREGWRFFYNRRPETYKEIVKKP